MISKKMHEYVKNSSVIRAMFEEGRRLSTIYGAENVYDFSLGNPNLEPPTEVKKAILEILNEEAPTTVHGYMNNSGYEDVRETIAQSINRKFDTQFHKENIIMSVGAGGGLNVIFKTILDPGDEVITFAPFFGEYKNYVANFDATLLVVPPDTETFQPNLEIFESYITKKTKAVLINSPNNPSGVVYSESTLQQLADILYQKQKEMDTTIYLISDEPYRELAYDGIEVPYPTKYYDNTIVGYSFSKSLSLPGERIGYLVIPSEVDDFENMISAANIATRILGFVNAPSLFQKVAAKCLDAKVDLEYYDRNRTLLYDSLRSFGYECIKPQGAFYLFVKSPLEDDGAFCAKAKEKRILLVPGSSFGCPGYVRIAYCVAYETIQRSLPSFQALMEELK
ncbi:pyridoxal phosphate-dependent aminotransferase [Alkalibacter rhizosphaerae]|uniref:Aminotransferase n=1 Tax=Alkalibacter rhizosphaerae TaxID=2815577 RepID=A0A974XHZ5_9FIRM|nr:pyridoxal phosphate-dependent aminotransferase [Alkalibacter rhizosphaerae]QSX09090.1 pyridoxal phosphate-dependent aminotransferase [Alkalibacter rhizosphaerae]